MCYTVWVDFHYFFLGCVSKKKGQKNIGGGGGNESRSLGYRVSCAERVNFSCLITTLGDMTGI